MRTIFSFSFSLICCLCVAQPSINWQKCIGGTDLDIAYCIQQTNDFGYIIAGTTNSTDGDVTGLHIAAQDFWIVKVDSLGAIQWQKCLGGTGGESAYSIVQTNDGGYAVAGASFSTDGDVIGRHGTANNYDYWIVKLSSSGIIQWSKCYGGISDDFAYSIQQTNNGGYIVGGSSYSTSNDISNHHGSPLTCDYWVAKLDSIGTIQWQYSYGDTLNDVLKCIQKTTDQGYILAGFTSSNGGSVTGNHGRSDIWIVKIDSIGIIQWKKCYGGSHDEYGEYIEQTLDGGYVIAGSAHSNDSDVTGHHGSGDYWILKINNTGGIIWQKTLGGNGADYATSIQQTFDSGYVAVGYSQSNNFDVTGNHGLRDYWIVKLNSIGTIQWQKSMGGTQNEVAYCLKINSSGGFIISGGTTSNDGDVTGNHFLGKNDFWIVSLNPVMVGIEEQNLIASTIKISPNPINANQVARLSLQSNTDENVEIKILDLVGRELGTVLPRTFLVPGENTLNIDFKNFAKISDGIYLIQINFGYTSAYKKVVIFN